MSQWNISHAVIIIGVLLLLSPSALSGVTLGAQTIHYDVGYVETTADGYRIDGATYGSFDTDILCWVSISRACQLERSLLETNVSIELGPLSYDRYSDYSYVYHNGTFYDVETSDTALWLRAVSNSTVFQNTATDGNELPADVTSALQDGQQEIATRDELPTNELITVENDRYAVLFEHHRSRGYLDGILHSIGPFLGPLGFLIGLGLVLQGQQWRVERRFR